jgi:hypothetical protein
MARKRVKRKRKKSNRRIKANSAHASLCALAPLITGRKIFDHIHQMVKIPQKKVDYSPSDKLVFVVIGIMSGCEAVFDLFHLQAKRFDSAESSQDALDKIVKKLSYHKLETTELTQHIQYASRGRPKADSPIKGIKWQITATVAPATTKVSHKQHEKACYVLGTSIPDSQLSDLEVIGGYKGQGAVERGFRFLKAPVFFVSSFPPQSAARHLCM